MATQRLPRILTVAGIAVCLLLAVTPNLFADSHARIVRLSDIEGKVQIDRNTGQGFERAIMNMPVTEGARIETGASGRAEVEFENGSVLRLADNSSVEFSGLSLRDDGQRTSEVRVNDGVVYVNYKHKDGGDFRLDIGKQTITVDHDAHFRVRLVDGGGDIAVFKGELDEPENGQVAKIKKDETLSLNFTDSSQNLVAKSVASFGSDQWDSERDAYDTQYAANYNKSQYPYQYGYSDLNYYGSFFNVGGYGSLWRPFGVSALWDPFDSGAWAYYPGAGYTWVSGYPWGWTPYRYGSWVFLPAYGWAWQPGGWNTWNAYPVVINAPTTWRRPMPPVRGILTPTVIVGHPTFTRPARSAFPGAVGARPSLGPATSTNAARPSRAPVGSASAPPQSHPSTSTTHSSTSAPRPAVPHTRN